MSLFKMGETAILQKGRFYPELNGEEVVVVGGLESYRSTLAGHCTFGQDVVGYRVILVSAPMPNGVDYIIAAPHQLRRKEPPKREIDQAVRWEDCAWRPLQEQA